MQPRVDLGEDRRNDRELPRPAQRTGQQIAGIEALEHQTRAAVDVEPLEYGRSRCATASRCEQGDPLALDLLAKRGRTSKAQDAVTVERVDLGLAPGPDPL